MLILLLAVPLLLGMREPQRALAAGVRVAVKGKPLPGGAFLAEEIELREEADRDEELRGLVESVEPEASRFRVLGFAVQVDDRTRFEREPAGEAAFEDLRPGLRVKVEGRRRQDGTFCAEEVAIRARQYPERRIVGTIEAVERGFRGTPVYQVLGRAVLVSEDTALATASGRSRPLLPRRLGELDDDDVAIRAAPGFGRRLAIGGEVRLRAERLDNADLDRARKDGELVPEVSAVAGVGFDLGPVFAYVELQGRKEVFLEGGPGFLDEGPAADVFVGQAYVEATPPGVPWLSVAVGRQKFRDERQWYFFNKNLDAVRVLADLWPVTVDLSLSRDLFDRSRNPRDQERTNRMATVSWSARREVRVEAYFVDRRDRTARGDSPRLLGMRVLADPGRRVELWADLAREGGTRGRLDSQTGRWIVRPVRARALDAGVTYRPRIALDPSFTVGFALGSGDATADLPPALQPASADRTFRQTGFHRNRDSWNGVVSFRYYGEAFDPELANLRILTLGVGLRPLRSVSADLVYHRYEQDVASRRIVDAELEADPAGTDRRLGREWDLAVGFEPDRRVELRLTAGRFLPGPAFESRASPMTVVRFQTKFRF